MDIVVTAMIGGFILLILATLWNLLVAPKEQKDPDRLFKHFVERYGFTPSQDAKLFNGFFANKSMQLRADPPGAFIQVPNPQGIHLLLEKGFSTVTEGLVDTPVEGAKGLTIKSNNPLLVGQMLDESLLGKLKGEDKYSFELGDGLRLRCDTRKPQDLEDLLRLGADLAAALERVNYAYSR
ncbi:hypothetical protein JXA12_00995 [Candidatus Woesearchaeota archaeon]|nr:hypothetical protein [Candidatus Woesearchaeota archaeon]